MREKDSFGIDGFCRRDRKSLKFGRLGRFAASIAICTAASILLAFLVVAAPAPASAQVSVGISVTIAPPALPIYVQPIWPGPGYIWTPGWWAWDPVFGYYWVPGTWVLAPYPGWYWTPGYWGWYGGAYVWYEGYWGPVVGFYGGINYGFGYNGYGYFGGYWQNGTFYYNRTVNNITTTNITNVYSKSIPRSATTTRVSYNGGSGGATLRPTTAQQDARQKGSAPIAAQKEHLQAAKRDPKLRASVNKGRPDIAATPKPGAFKDPGVVRANKAGAPYKAPPPSREAPSGAPGKPGKPSGMEKRAPAAEPKREAPSKLKRETPSAPGEHPSVPKRERVRPEPKPMEPHREIPRPERMERPNMERQQMAPRPAPEKPERLPKPSAPGIAPEQREIPPHGGGMEREERGPRQ